MIIDIVLAIKQPIIIRVITNNNGVTASYNTMLYGLIHPCCHSAFFQQILWPDRFFL